MAYIFKIRCKVIRLTSRLLFLSVFLLRTFPAVSQKSDELRNPLSIAIHGHYGFILPHSEAIAEISGSNPRGMEADLAWHLMGERIWKQCYCFPRTGFSLSYFNFNLPEVLGHSVFLYPYLEPWIRPKENLSISFRLGIGPAWVSSLYDASSNPDAYFFSSHLNFIIALNAALNYRLSSKLATRVAVNFNHISNGGLNRPNVGMDFLTLNAGIDYSFRELRFPCRTKDTLQSSYAGDRWWDAYLLGTMRKAGTLANQSLPVIGAGIYYNQLTGQHLALNTGVEWVSDFSLKEEIRQEYLNDPGSAPDHNRVAILAGFDLVFGRITLVHQWGIYVYEPYPAGSWAYQRYGLNLRIRNRFYLGIHAKAYGYVPVLVDARLGILL